MNLAEGVTPELQKEGTFEIRPYDDNTTRAYVMNAACIRVTIDVPFLDIQEGSAGYGYDWLQIGKEKYFGRNVGPFKVKVLALR